MTTKTLNVYSIYELDEKVQKKLYSNWLNDYDFPWHHYYEKTLDSFCNEFFSFKICDYEISDYRYNFDFEKVSHESIFEDKKTLINLKNKLIDKKFHITGCFTDYYITDPINAIDIDELKKFVESDTIDLLYDCIESFFIAWVNDIEYDSSFKNFLELCDCNEYLENGVLV